ncbi:MAG: hypothetical protein AAF291_11570 [Pseudomonadota bacterium]
MTGLVGAGAVLAEPAIIVKSSADDYKVGSKIDDEDTITLASGERVSVLTKRGSRTMRGPGTFVVGADPKSNRNRFANLKRRGAAKRSGTGGVRSAATAAVAALQSPKVFYADVGRSGRLCLTNTQDVSLWRAFSDRPATYVVSGPDLDAPVTVSFEADVSVAPPEGATLALMDGGTYTITGGSAGPGPAMTIATVTIVDLGQDYPTADGLAQALFGNGCTAQFNVLSDRLFTD